MPGLRILCLHGAGSNAEVMRTQLGPVAKMLQQHGTATFEYYEGTLASEAGPGVSGMFDGPFYSFFAWPPTFSGEDDESIREACEDLEDYMEETGPYDALLGFSHGTTLVTEFLCDYARRNPGVEPPCRAAVFLNGIPSYRMGDDEKPVIDLDLLEHFPSIPTLHVVGKKDFVFEYSTVLHEAMPLGLATLVTHDKGHEVANDVKTLQKITKAIEQLSIRIALGC